ncbi:UbiH/UbiF family hydroxylase [Fluviibacterium sp. S390]|uniref:UbiH/UbiF family hydroxylase n=1 Tax=Fluviibacterium sp. S390 TaxID=3415139 RepID=UPI003C7E1983
MSSAIQDFDIVVAGGGIAGLAAATAFGHLGLRTLCVDPAVPVTERDVQGADLRSTAFLQPSRDLFDRIGVWDRLAPHAADLQIMRIVDAGGVTTEPRLTRDFDAADISSRPFGWNLSNWLLRREFLAAVADQPTVTHRTGVGVRDVLPRSAEAIVQLSDGSRARARLVVAADGRNSTVRQQAGIGVRTTRYAQKALAFAVTHDAPHDNVSTEIHRSGGPFTLVPLPDHKGLPCSAVVWMEHGPEAHRLLALDEDAFSAAATARSGGLYGPLTLTSQRTLWPIISQIADRFDAPRVALMAEAAHVVPPIGAQGLNMSLADLATLLDLIDAAPQELGSPDSLARYARARRPEVLARIAGVDLLNRASMLSPQPLRDLRRSGLAALYGLAPVRKRLMQLGLGAKG